MKRFFLILLALVMTGGAALSLSQSSIPPKFGVPWGSNAGAAYIRSIPTTSQIGILNCAASLPDGFPPLTFVPSGAGGCPPFGQDFNGILKQLSQWNQWQSAGGPVFYDSAFATAAGGYPSGARLASAVTPGTVWFNTVDNNVTNPDALGAGWEQDPGQVPIGTPVQSLTTRIPPGYVSANGLAIGDAASNATGRANADTVFLFSFVWSFCPSAQCPIFTSTGSASTRGASAAADYAAHKALAVQNLNGTGLMGADSQNGSTSALLAGVPITSGSTTVPGSILGENLHSLISAENGPHTHGITDPGHAHGITDPGHVHGITDPGHSHGTNAFTGVSGIGGFLTSTGLVFGGATINPATTGITINRTTTGITINGTTTGISVNSSGAGTGHNTVERSTIVYWNLKL